MTNRTGIPSAGLAGIASVFVLAFLVRLQNAWFSPLLEGYDAFGHFTYVWFLAEARRSPLATHGWSFFHPPLWYSLMAFVWRSLEGVDPVVRLKSGKMLIASLGCVHPLDAGQLALTCGVVFD